MTIEINRTLEFSHKTFIQAVEDCLRSTPFEDIMREDAIWYSVNQAIIDMKLPATEPSSYIDLLSEEDKEKIVEDFITHCGQVLSTRLRYRCTK